MNVKEFERSIQGDALAKHNDSTKFIYKSYLVLPLRGGKYREAYIYSLAETIGPTDSKVLNKEMKSAYKALVDYFKKMIKQKYWEEVQTIHYDKNGEPIWNENVEEDIIEPTVSVTTIKRYHIDKDRINEIGRLKDIGVPKDRWVCEERGRDMNMEGRPLDDEVFVNMQKKL